MRIVSGLIVVVVLLAASCGGEGRGSPAHALPDASSALIDRLLDAIVPIDDPVYEEASRADEWLKGDDVVVGYFDAGQAWAYPVRILNFHEIVNDELAGLPALVSYCPLCGSAVVYDRRLDGDVLTFSNTSALYENDLVMVDRQTGTYWWQVPGRGLVGPLAGAELAPLPSFTTTVGVMERRAPRHAGSRSTRRW